MQPTCSRTQHNISAAQVLDDQVIARSKQPRTSQEPERHRRSTADKRASDRNKSVARFDHNCAGRSQDHTSTAYRGGGRRSRTGSRRSRSSDRLERLVLVLAVQLLRANRAMRGRLRQRYPQAPTLLSTSAISFYRTQRNTAYVKLRETAICCGFR